MNESTSACETAVEQALGECLARLRPELERTLAELIRIPSENLPPDGNEQQCQMYIAGQLRTLGLEPDVYDISEVAGLTRHPEYWPGRNYSGRPNVDAVLTGSGGRSLVLSGHVDTVPHDTPVPWTYSPTGAEVAGGRMYGRGSWDMKAGVAMNLTVVRVLRELNAKLKGTLIFETVVDEEFGGVNGTLAGRLRGYNADAAIIGEPTALNICPAGRGGRTIHILFQGKGGILATGKRSGRAVDQLSYVLDRLPEFVRLRESRVNVHPYFKDFPEPCAVWVTNISTGRWGWTQPITIPERCQMELYWQAMPDETGEQVVAEFFEWWNAVLDARPDLFGIRPEVQLPMRWLPGCAIPADSPLVQEFASTAASFGVPSKIEGLDAPSDMFMFQRCFNTPAIMWGPHGANAHQADEFVELDSLFQATRVLLRFVSRWCGVELHRA
ncbi:MAG: M20/M25/M40 family metallo-hydrolase [Acidobacteria bacterium]|nr:M20/M25/M40 family metallo-hydrolase [Acidobacteriota bacterium]